MTGETPQTPDPNVGRRAEPGAAPVPPAGGQPAAQPTGDAHASTPPSAQPAGDAHGSTHSPAQAGHGYEQASHPSGPGDGPGNTPAVVALILGILALVTLIFTFGVLFFVSLPVGIAAIVLGVLGRRKVARGETRQFRGLATAGAITGAVATVLSLLALVLLVLFVGAIGSATPSNFNDLQQQLEEQQEQQEP